MTEMCTDTFNWQQYCIVSFWASGAVAGSMLLGSTSIAIIYCKTGNVNKQVMLTNLTSGMGSLIFLPRQQLYPINNYIP